MPGYVVADAAELRTVDMTGVTETRLRYVASFSQWFTYNSGNNLVDNGEWIIQPTTGGGNWTPSGPIFGTSTPSGSANTPVIYHRVQIASGGNFVDRIYSNPGGSNEWRFSTAS